MADCLHGKGRRPPRVEASRCQFLGALARVARAHGSGPLAGHDPTPSRSARMGPGRDGRRAASARLLRPPQSWHCGDSATSLATPKRRSRARPCRAFGIEVSWRSARTRCPGARALADVSESRHRRPSSFAALEAAILGPLGYRPWSRLDTQPEFSGRAASATRKSGTTYFLRNAGLSGPTCPPRFPSRPSAAASAPGGACRTGPSVPSSSASGTRNPTRPALTALTRSIVPKIRVPARGRSRRAATRRRPSRAGRRAARAQVVHRRQRPARAAPPRSTASSGRRSSALTTSPGPPDLPTRNTGAPGGSPGTAGHLVGDRAALGVAVGRRWSGRRASGRSRAPTARAGPAYGTRIAPIT